jgi:hypothetical protein
MNESNSNQPPVGAAAGTNGTDMVVVGCKLPNGLILEIGKPGEDKYARIQLRGANSSRVIGGCGLTDVPRDFITAWLKKNNKLSFVQQRLIFVGNDAAEASAVAVDRATQRTGFEPLNPKDAPKGVDVDTKHMETSMRDLQRFKTAAA